MSSTTSQHSDPQLVAAIQIYQTALSAYVSGQSDVTSTTSALVEPTNSAYINSSTKAGLLVQALWAEIFGSVKQASNPSYCSGTPESANIRYLQRLVHLVDAIRRYPAPSTTTVQNLDLDSWPITPDAPLWSGLPGFGAAARELWNVDVSTLPMDLAQINSWTNLNSFIALTWSRYPIDSTPTPFDCALYAIWTLRLALETQQSNDVLSALISAAAAWIDIPEARIALWAECVKGRSWPPAPKTGAPAKTGPLWNEAGKQREDGFSVHRWNFWSERLREIGHNSEGATKETALNAAENMAALFK